MSSMLRNAGVRPLVGAAALVAMAGTAMAQPVVVVRQFSSPGVPTTVPGLPANQQSGAPKVWSAQSGFWGNDVTNAQGASANSIVPSIDNFGNVAFFGQIDVAAGVINNGNSTTPGNQDAIFYAKLSDGYSFTNSDAIVVRDGNPGFAVPQQGGPTPARLPSGWYINQTTIAGRNGLSSGVALSSNGQMASTAFVTGSGAVSNTNGTAIFTGTSSGLSTVVRRSDAAPGTDNIFGANSPSATNNLNIYPMSSALPGTGNPLVVNTSGQVVFTTEIATGTGTAVLTSGANQNNLGMWIGSPGTGAGTLGNLAKVYRRGDFIPGGSFVFGSPPANSSRSLNASGEVAFLNNLSTTTTVAGTTAATTSNNGGFFMYSGGANTVIGREGSAVGGSSTLAAATYFIDTSTAPATAPFLSLSHQTLNNNHRVMFDATFNVGSGPVTAAANGEALMTWTSASGAQPVFRTATDPVPGVAGATFSTFRSGSSLLPSRINNLDHVLVSATMTVGGSVTAATNNGLWLASDLSNASGPGNSSLIARGGDDVSALLGQAPGSVSFSNTFTSAIIAGGSDIVVFQNTLSDGRLGIFGWTAATGLLKVAVVGDTSFLGASYPLTAMNYNVQSNGDGGVQGLNDQGYLVMSVLGQSGANSNNAIVVFQVPAPAGAGLAFLGLAAAARRWRR